MDELCHYGIKGQKWGVRRFQNSDGSYTSEGKRRAQQQEKKDPVKEMKDEMFIEESAAQMICDAFLFAVTSRQTATVTATQLNAAARKNITLGDIKKLDCLSADEQFWQGEVYYFGTNTVS